MKYKNHSISFRIRYILLIFLLGYLMAGNQLFGQEPPPRPLTITPTAQGLSFGTFSQGAAGGTVTVTASGGQSGTGDVILLTMAPFYSPAAFDVVGNPGTMVSILVWPASVLNGSMGGSMTLQINSLYPTPFIITTNPPLSTTMYLGGTLTVNSPALNPPGTYTGTFNITFIQE
jgi:hypothetical protein